MLKRIILSGGWGYGNIGDEAILKYTYQDLKKIFPGTDIVVLSFDAKETENHQSIESSNNLHLLLKLNAGAGLIEECKKILNGNANIPKYLYEYLHYFDQETLFVMAGGGYFNDHWLESFYVHLTEIKIANMCGAKIAIIGQTFGPISGSKHLKMLANCIKLVDFIDVRDKTSYEFLSELVEEKEIHLSCDAVVRNGNEQRRVKESKVIGVMFQRKRPYTHPNTSKMRYRVEQLTQIVSGQSRTFTDSLCQIIKKIQIGYPDYSIVFLQSTDWREKEIEKLRQRCGAKTVYVNCTVDEYISIINRCSLVITTNMHPSIFATTVGIPAISISHTYKMDDYMEEVGLGAYSFHDMKPNEIYHAVDELLQSVQIEDKLLEKNQELRLALDQMYQQLKKVVEED